LGFIGSGFKVQGFRDSEVLITLSAEPRTGNGKNNEQGRFMISKASVGVEISNSHLTIAHARSTLFDTKVTAHAVYDLDVTATFAEKLDTIHTRVKDFLHQHHIRSACLWIGLPAEMVIHRVIRLTSSAKENLAKALEYELTK
jgi:Tfp pilus assembly PilM family ATPase